MARPVLQENPFGHCMEDKTVERDRKQGGQIRGYCNSLLFLTECIIFDSSKMFSTYVAVILPSSGLHHLSSELSWQPDCLDSIPPRLCPGPSSVLLLFSLLLATIISLQMTNRHVKVSNLQSKSLTQALVLPRWNICCTQAWQMTQKLLDKTQCTGKLHIRSPKSFC